MASVQAGDVVASSSKTAIAKSGEESLFDIRATVREIFFGSVSVIIFVIRNLCTFLSDCGNGCGNFRISVRPSKSSSSGATSGSVQLTKYDVTFQRPFALFATDMEGRRS